MHSLRSFSYTVKELTTVLRQEPFLASPPRTTGVSNWSLKQNMTIEFGESLWWSWRYILAYYPGEVLLQCTTFQWWSHGSRAFILAEKGNPQLRTAPSCLNGELSLQDTGKIGLYNRNTQRSAVRACLEDVLKHLGWNTSWKYIRIDLKCTRKHTSFGCRPTLFAQLSTLLIYKTFASAILSMQLLDINYALCPLPHFHQNGSPASGRGLHLVIYYNSEYRKIEKHLSCGNYTNMNSLSVYFTLPCWHNLFIDHSFDFLSSDLKMPG